jgi:hypothetical protein
MARTRKAKSPVTLTTASFAGEAAREAARIQRLLLSPDPDAHVRAWRQSLHDAHIVAWLGTPEVLLAAVERLEREDADTLAADQAARLDVKTTVVRPQVWMLQNDFYRLADSLNDGWNEIQRAKAEADAKEAFAEKIVNMSPGVRRSQQSRKRQLEREAQRAELDALILAEEPAARAAVRERSPWLKTIRHLVDKEIEARLRERRIEVRVRRIKRARSGR